MTFFGIIWACTMVFCFKKRNIKYIFFATLIFMTFQCANVLHISSGRGVGPQVLTSICFIIKYFLHSRFRVSRISIDKSCMAWLTLIAVALLIVISGVANKTLASALLVTIQLFVYIFVFLIMRRVAKEINRGQLYKIIRMVVIFVVVVGVLQWIVTMYIPVARPILKILFYNDNNEDVYFNFTDRGHNRRIYSTFMEPSYLAAFAVGSFYFLLCFWERLRENLFLLLMLFIIIAVSLSSTAYGAFIITGSFFIISSKEIKIKWKLLIVFLAAGVALVFFTMFYDVLDAVIFSKASTGSGVTRAGWNREAYAAFLSSPIIGIGYKAIRGSSIIYTLMGELGILGVVLYIVFNVSSVWRCIFRGQHNKYSTGYYGVLYAVLSSFICMVIACPDLDLCSYWFWLYLLACYNGHELIKYKKIKNYTNSFIHNV